MRASNVVCIFSTFGVAVCLYMIYIERTQGFCPAGVCSIYPAIFGLAWFAPAPIVLKKYKLKIAWQVSGILAVAAFLLYEVIKAQFCLYCSIAHIIGLLAIITSTYTKPQESKSKNGE